MQGILKNLYFLEGSTLKPRYNELRYSEFRDIVNKTQFVDTKNITFDIINYSIQ